MTDDPYDQQSLDLPQDVFRLVRINEVDAKYQTDDFVAFRNLISQSESAYPNILRWFDSKVRNGLRSGERTGFLGLINERPAAVGVLKKGRVSKFCHLKIEPDARSRSLGDLFFSLMALEVRHVSQQVRFTLPESVWESRKSFFNAFSFLDAREAGKQYRLFDSELYSETQFQDLFQASRQKLPQIIGQFAIGRHSLLTGAVLALQPDPLWKILTGVKKVEIRARFSRDWEGRKISLYGTRPVSGLAGEATVERVIEGEPNRIWEIFGHLIGCAREQYDAYVGKRERVSAIFLKEVQAFRDPVPLAQLSALLGVKLPVPQSYLSLENNDGWLMAVALAASLQGSVRLPVSPVVSTKINVTTQRIAI